jgi:hypothetical protein
LRLPQVSNIPIPFTTIHQPIFRAICGKVTFVSVAQSPELLAI